MGRILLFLLIFTTGISMLIAPWVAGLAYVANSLLQPQYIWFWVFDGVSIFRITAGLAILAFLFSVAQKNINFEVYKQRQNVFLLFIWLWMHLSHQLSSYKGVTVSVSPEVVLDTINSIMIMYFLLIALFENKGALKYLSYVFVFCGVFYVYWANAAYFSQDWHRFVNGRLVGPSGSPYRDANVLSTLIVMCIPFLIFLFFRINNRFIKVSLLLIVPMAWHAMILFGSRAALLASVISILAVAYTLRSTKVNFLIGTTFLLFMTYQGTMLLDRTTETIERAQVYKEEPINPRLISWEIGMKLIPDYPLFGAGVQMYEAAARNHFPGETPHVAHNTFLNFSVNTGLITGVLFLGLIWLAWRRLKAAISMKISYGDSDYYALVSSSISLIGFFVCSMFLDLIIFEPFYIVLAINMISYYRVSKIHETSSTGTKSTPEFRSI